MSVEKIERKEVLYTRHLKELLEQIPKGAFLTVKTQDKINTMTIGWATSGVMWGRQVLVIGVRPSRYSYEGIDMDKEFTVSIPMNQKLKKEITYCGTHSGRDVDKFENCNIHALEGHKVDVPIIEECGLHYECRVIAKHQLIPEYIDQTINDRYYPEGDYHMIFYGEILSSYRID
ncbi:flavin reductase family protein [Vallitaleaceae bacterium 9-2]